MKRSRGHFLRFIDLGLLLLLAFLSVAELNPTLQSPLPGRRGNPTDVIAVRVVFNENWSAVLTRLDPSAPLCQTTTISELSTCMQRYASMRFLLAPEDKATVQQIVTLLDLCKKATHACEIEPLHP